MCSLQYVQLDHRPTDGRVRGLWQRSRHMLRAAQRAATGTIPVSLFPSSSRSEMSSEIEAEEAARERAWGEGSPFTQLIIRGWDWKKSIEITSCRWCGAPRGEWCHGEEGSVDRPRAEDGLALYAPWVDGAHMRVLPEGYPLDVAPQWRVEAEENEHDCID